MNRILLALCAFPLLIHAQTTEQATQRVLGYDVSNNLVYVCTARSYYDQRQVAKISISAISKAAAAEVTSAGHGFPASSRPTVTISGATGTGWASGANTVNGTFVATVTGVNTFTIPVDTQTNGTLAGSVVFTTTAPRTGVSEWSVQRLIYDVSNNLIWSGWQGGASSFNQKCSDATSTTNNMQ